MVLLGMINVALKLLGGSLIWKDYCCVFFCCCFFQFPEENGIIVFLLLEGSKPISRSAIIICTFP